MKKTLLFLTVIFSTQLLTANQNLYENKDLSLWIKNQEGVGLFSPPEPLICKRNTCSSATVLCDSVKNLKSNQVDNKMLGSLIVVFSHMSLVYFNDKQ